MKRKIQKKLIAKSTIKAQLHKFTESFVSQISSSPEFESGLIPLRGPLLLNFGVKVGFDFPSWNNFIKSSLSDNDSVDADSDIFFMDEAHFSSMLPATVKHIKNNYLPDVDEEHIKSALRYASIDMPRARTKGPLTQAGRKLCYKLCDSNLTLTTLSNKVKVIIDDTEYDAFLTYFSHSVNNKTGSVDEEFGRVYVKDLSKMVLVDVNNIRAVSDFDAFAHLRKFEIGSYQDFINEYSYRKPGEKVPSGYVTMQERLEIEEAKGKKTYFAIRKWLSNEIHEFPMDASYLYDMVSLREQYHDTEELIFISR